MVCMSKELANVITSTGVETETNFIYVKDNVRMLESRELEAIYVCLFFEKEKAPKQESISSPLLSPLVCSN